MDLQSVSRPSALLWQHGLSQQTFCQDGVMLPLFVSVVTLSSSVSFPTCCR